MGQALIGLAGVIVGALLSGGATYVMARRAEARRARAAARLLEGELRPAARWLHAFRAALALAATEHDAVGELLLLPDPRLWDDNKSMLADVLKADDWYALVAAYDSIDILRRITQIASRASPSYIDLAILEPAILLVEGGAEAVSHLAGGKARSRGALRAVANHDALVANLLRVGAFSGDSDAVSPGGPAAPDASQTHERRA